MAFSSSRSSRAESLRSRRSSAERRRFKKSHRSITTPMEMIERMINRTMTHSEPPTMTKSMSFFVSIDYPRVGKRRWGGTGKENVYDRTEAMTMAGM